MSAIAKTWRENWLLILIFIGLLALPFAIGAFTGSSPYGVPRGDRMVMRGESVRWQAVLIEVFILSILAMSYNLMFGFTGIVSFGHALFFGLGGYALGLALEYTALDTGVGLLIGIIAGLVISGLVGLVIGLVSLRVRGAYFAIFTLAIAETAFIFFSRLRLTNAEDGFPITDLPTWIDPSQNRLTFYFLTLALFVFTFLFIRRLVNSPSGAVFKAIRDNEDRAQAIGYNTLNYKLLSIVAAGVLAAMAGMLQAILNKKVGPELFGITYTVDPLLMTIIGGIGTFVGPIIGAGGLHLLETTLRQTTFTIGSSVIVFSDIWGLLLGAVFIVVVLIFPQGIVGTWMKWRAKRLHRRSERTRGETAEAPS